MPDHIYHLERKICFCYTKISASLPKLKQPTNLYWRHNCSGNPWFDWLKILEKKNHSNLFDFIGDILVWLYVVIMSCTLFRVNLHFIVAWKSTNCRHDVWSLSDSNEIRTQNQLVCKQTLNHSTGKWLSVYLRTKCLWVRVPLLSLFLVCLSSCQSQTDPPALSGNIAEKENQNLTGQEYLRF